MKSVVRDILKPILYSLLGERVYISAQTFSKIRDILKGVDDEKEISLIPYLVREGDTVIDMGANYALYTYHLSKAVGAHGQVHAFEPIPFAYQVCSRIMKRLGLSNVRLYQKGCSHTNGKVYFTVPLQSFGGVSAGQSHLATRNNDLPGKEQHFKFDKWKSMDCEVVRVDEFLPELDNVSFIKADIEGAEYYALQGAVRIIARHHPTVLCEINPFFLEGFQIKLQDLIDFFTERGYGLYFYRAEGGPILEEVSAGDVVEANYLFVHPERMDRLAHLQRKPPMHQSSAGQK